MRAASGFGATGIVAAITLAGAAVRLVILQDSLFADELSTYWIVSEHSLGGVISTVHTDAEITPPLYFVLAWLTTRLDLTAEMLRAPSFLAGVGSDPPRLPARASYRRARRGWWRAQSPRSARS